MTCVWIPRKFNLKVILCIYVTPFLTCSLKTFQEKKYTNILVCIYRQFTELMFLYKTLCDPPEILKYSGLSLSDGFVLQGRLLGRKFLQLMIEKRFLIFLSFSRKCTDFSQTIKLMFHTLELPFDVNKFKCIWKPITNFWISDFWGKKKGLEFS